MFCLSGVLPGAATWFCAAKSGEISFVQRKSTKSVRARPVSFGAKRSAKSNKGAARQSRSRSSAELYSAVSRICNPLATTQSNAPAKSCALPNGIRRDGRLEICATPSRGDLEKLAQKNKIFTDSNKYRAAENLPRPRCQRNECQRNGKDSPDTHSPVPVFWCALGKSSQHATKSGNSTAGRFPVPLLVSAAGEFSRR